MQLPAACPARASIFAQATTIEQRIVSGKAAETKQGWAASRSREVMLYRLGQIFSTDRDRAVGRRPLI